MGEGREERKGKVKEGKKGRGGEEGEGGREEGEKGEGREEGKEEEGGGINKRG